NEVLKTLFKHRPHLLYLMAHNIDTLGASLDPALFGVHIERGAAMSMEVIGRDIDDRGGGLARIDGRGRLLEGLALPSAQIGASRSYYSLRRTWIDIDQLLTVCGLGRWDLEDSEKVSQTGRNLAARMSTYITI